MDIAGKLSNCRFEGFVARPDGRGGFVEGSIRNIGSHKNLVLDNGLRNLLSTSVAINNTFRIGTGTTPVERSQSSLAAIIPGAVGQFEMTAGSGSSTSGTDELGIFSEWSCTGQSPVFTSNTNVTELSFGQTGAATNLMSRALTVNSAGTPTAITVLVGEVLVLTYYFRLYIPSGSISGTMTVNTAGVPVEHDWVSVPQVGQVLGIGSANGLNLLNLTTQILAAGSVRTFTAVTPVITEDGAYNTFIWSKAGNTGLATIGGMFSVSTVARSLPVNIKITPSYQVTNDQRASIGFMQYLTQDYS